MKFISIFSQRVQYIFAITSKNLHIFAFLLFCKNILFNFVKYR